MELSYRSHYFGDDSATASFEQCAKAVFGLEFHLWKEKGLWPDLYTAFSAFHGERCVASLCVYPAEMMIEGQQCTGAQLLTVGTLPEYRGMGIQRELWRRASEWIRPRFDFTFLFTEYTAWGFYEKVGFKRRTEFTRIFPLQPDSRLQTGPGEGYGKQEFRKLDMANDNDYELVERVVRERTVVSRRFGSKNPNLTLFLFLYVYRNVGYYLPEFDCVVVVEKAPDRIRLHDVIASKIPTFSQLQSFMQSFGKPRVEVLFCPDQLELPGDVLQNITYLGLTGNDLFVTSEIDLPKDTLFPFSLRA